MQPQQEVRQQQLLLLLCLSLGVIGQSSPGGATCPDRAKGLVPWRPGHNASLRADIGPGQALLLVASASFHSVHVHGGGKLVIADRRDEAIVVRTRSILIEDGGELHVGSEDCPYLGSLTISLYSRSDEVTEEAHPYFGLKFVGVGRGGTLEVHGAPKLSWTFLNGTVHPPPPGEEAAAGGSRGRSGSAAVKSYRLERSWGYRGIVVHVLEHNTGAVLSVDRFDTFKSRAESRRLASHLDSLASGRVVSMAVNDDGGSRNLDAAARVAVQRLGGRAVGRLAFRQPWAFVAVKGDPSSAVESQGTTAGTTGRTTAEAAKLFRTAAGDLYTVSTLSEWTQDVEWTDWFNRDDQGGTGDWENLSTLRSENPGAICAHPLDIQVTTLDGLPAELTLQGFHRSNRAYGFACRNQDQQGGRCQNYRVRFLCGHKARPSVRVTVEPLSNATVLTLAEDVRSWRAGERVVVASTDFSMHQAEEFTLLPCPECAANQVKVDGKPRFTHVGEVVDGVDMRAEVGLLTRNVVVQGEMEPSCYGDNACRFFSFDTFGGHIKVTANFSAVGLSHVELTRMGQQVLGSYPLHFHMCGAVDEPALYPTPPAVVGLAVHHCFSRCVTIHGTSGLQVSDTVGYDTLGHCFFMEDGAEQRNTLARNLGLLTRPGTLLPTDRGDAACLALRGAVHPGYTPNPSADCMAVSTFWISHPNNNLIDNAAAGAQDVGFWFAFHRVPTGPSAGALPEGHSELSPLGLFRNNRAHSNSKAGVFLDKGVKVTHASAQSPREYLSPVTARYRPHEDADPAKPAVAAVFDRLVAFRNDHGAWLRGGTISVRNSAFADNAIGITFASDGTFPTDEGSSQEVTDSIFVGESGNLGTNGGHNRFWGAGADGRFRTMARTSSFPVRGVQLYDGPCRVERCTFRHFAPTRDRRSSAIGFFLRNVWQMTPQNNVSRVRMDDSVKLSVNFGKPGPWFEDNDLDGDKNSIFHDVDGSVSGFPDSHVARADNALLWTPACHMQSDWNAMICPGRYAQLYVQARRPQNLTLSVRRERSAGAAAGVMTLRGLYPPSGSTAAFQQYQPVVQLGTDYSLRWDGPSPDEVTIYLVNFNRGDWVRVALCYPRGTAFSVVSDVHQRQLSQVHGAQRLHPAASPDALRAAHGRRLYFHDASTGLLHLHVSSSRERHGNAYCSATGCERVRIIATPPRGTAASTQPATCQEASEATTATAPSVAAAAPTSRSLSPAESSPSPNAEFPRDRLLGPVTTPCPGCGAPQLLITSDPHHTYLPIDIHVAEPGEIRDGGRVANYVEVNGTRLALDSPGLLLVAVDACSGRLLSKKTLRTPPVNVTRFTLARLPKRSIVVLASGQLNQTPADDLAAALLLIGAPSGVVPFQGGSLAMVGYLGDSTPPSWVKLTSKLPGSGVTSLQAYVPLAWKGSGCLEAGEMGKGAAIEEGQGKAQASTSGQNTAYKPSRTSG